MMYIFDLIKEYTDLALIGSDGFISLPLERGIPPVKEIDSVLYNIYLDTIDTDIDKEYPPLVFVRFLHVYALCAGAKSGACQQSQS